MAQLVTEDSRKRLNFSFPANPFWPRRLLALGWPRIQLKCRAFVPRYYRWVTTTRRGGEGSKTCGPEERRAWLNLEQPQFFFPPCHSWFSKQTQYVSSRLESLVLPFFFLLSRKWHHHHGCIWCRQPSDGGRNAWDVAKCSSSFDVEHPSTRTQLPQNKDFRSVKAATAVGEQMKRITVRNKTIDTLNFQRQL